MKVLYTTTALAQGGRNGHVRTNDGTVDTRLAVPASMGGSGEKLPNPEQFFAAGYAACFDSALNFIAAKHRIPISASSVEATVGIGMTGRDSFGLEVHLAVKIDGIEEAQARELLEAAHGACPYSNAIRGNVPVTLELIK